MILNEREIKLAKELARELVTVQKEKERLYRMEQQRLLEESFESFGRGIRIARDSIIDGFVRPIVNMAQSIERGFNR